MSAMEQTKIECVVPKMKLGIKAKMNQQIHIP